MKTDNNSLGKGIGTAGVWLGIGAISFSGVIDNSSTMLIIIVIAALGTVAIWEKT